MSSTEPAPKWQFPTKRPCDTADNPKNSEHFSSDDFSNIGEAVVREGIQNARDARRLDHTGPVHVRIRVARGSAAAQPSVVTPLFGTLSEHVAACAGLRDRPSSSDACDFLVFEDEGTTGLIGDIEADSVSPTSRNPFYAFVRSEGMTDKAGGKGGSWGIGKTVFRAASRARAALFVTNRFDDGRTLVAGRATLQVHSLGRTNHFANGTFGVQSDGPDSRIDPATDSRTLKAVASAFGVDRTDRPGLSIVVPWVDGEVRKDNLIAAVLRHWLHPLLAGGLNVTVEDAETGPTMITPSNLSELVASLPEDRRTDIATMAKLVTAEVTGSASAVVFPQLGVSGVPQWSKLAITPDETKGLRATLESGKPVVVRVPLVVSPKGQAAQLGHFLVTLVPEPGGKAGRVTFVRDGIVILRAKSDRISSMNALITIDRNPLADLLRAAENIAHLEWSKDTENFKGAYEYGPSVLTVMKQAAATVIRLITDDGTKEDKQLLRDIFSLPRVQEDDSAAKATRRKKKRKKTDIVEGAEEVDVEPQGPKAFALAKVEGGFTLTGGGDGSPALRSLRVTMAYDRRDGSSIKKYHPADFKVDALDAEHEGVRVLHNKNNLVRLEITSPTFRYSLRGFDKNRQLIVRAQAADEQEAANA